MLFLGQYHHTIDDKNRLTVPSKFRDVLKNESVLYVSKGLDNCLELRDEKQFNVWAEKLRQLGDGKKTARALTRQIMSQSGEVTIDNSGRIKINQFQLDLIGIKKDVVIVGNNNKLEFWTPEAWEKYQTDNSSLEDYADELGDSF
ncbi:division/cell wall cluster transcriptional repressor MraZ [Spiroplasma endosymbiont of Amphibalanus improvisus]|uniref:division/cell wall cluster transcriptional repressor MraZ n=1 Tax=Spiroplasma endosymbiont of Amphibalanus improvisus TaxID=3066327 RepID=UPI00313E25C8